MDDMVFTNQTVLVTIDFYCINKLNTEIFLKISRNTVFGRTYTPLTALKSKCSKQEYF